GAARCRNIKTLFNFQPPATEAEIRDAALQFVRKLSGFTAPSKANQAAFDRAVEGVAASGSVLIRSLVTQAQPPERDVDVATALGVAPGVRADSLGTQSLFKQQGAIQSFDALTGKGFTVGTVTGLVSGTSSAAFQLNIVGGANGAGSLPITFHDHAIITDADG